MESCHFIMIFITVFFYKIISNAYFLIKCKYFFRYFLEGKIPTSNKQEIVKLFKRANIKDVIYPEVIKISSKHIAHYSFSIFDNIDSNKKPVLLRVKNMFNEAIGVYKSRILEALNPIYWIDLIVFAPKNILINYLNLNEKLLSYKLLNLVLTIIWWFIGTFFTFYRSELTNFIIHIFTNS